LIIPARSGVGIQDFPGIRFYRWGFRGPFKRLLVPLDRLLILWIDGFRTHWLRFMDRGHGTSSSGFN
jgi:hypothetical protein